MERCHRLLSIASLERNVPESCSRTFITVVPGEPDRDPVDYRSTRERGRSEES